MNANQAMTRQEKIELLIQFEEKKRRLCANKLPLFKPHPWQREFIRASANFSECMASKANRVGGTILMACMAAVWLTGRYEDNMMDSEGNIVRGITFPWEGKRFDHSVRGLVVGKDLDQIRGSSQKLLLGEGKPWGTGRVKDIYPLIPADALDSKSITMDTENRGTIDYVRVKHVNGEYSVLYFISQKQDWRKIMGDEFDFIMNDEFPENYRMYTQQLARIASSNGGIYTFATPENGRNKITDRFTMQKPKKPDGTPITWYKFIHIREAKHFTPERIEEIIASYPPQERPFRVEGKPAYGMGFIFRTPPSAYKCPLVECPPLEECQHICGLDWGRSDYGALVWVMYYEINDTWYVWRARRIRHLDPSAVAIQIKSTDKQLGMSVPVSWGQDAANTDATSGTSVYLMLRDADVNILKKSAHNAFMGDKNKNIFPGVYYMQEMLENNLPETRNITRRERLKIIDIPDNGWLFEELSLYYMNEDGHIPKKAECRFDGIDALRYALIMGKHAIEPSHYRDKLFFEKVKQKSETNYSIYA